MTRMEATVTNDDSATTHARVSAARRALVACLLLLGANVLAACTSHQVSQVHPCAAPSSRGASQLPKVGLTPAVLKAQMKCK
jgi:hypothetical protein